MNSKTISIMIFLLFAMAIFITGCTVAGVVYKDDSAATPESLNNVTTSNTHFAFDMYKQLDSGDRNVFFSPYSISSALAMTYEGARGDTAAEMKNVLHLSDDGLVRRSGYARIYNELNAKDRQYTLNTANALWAQKNYTFSQDYLDLMDKYYDGKVTTLDFVKDAQGSKNTINNWISDNTNGKIKDVIPDGFITPYTRLILTNAIYFKGSWEKAFDKKLTQDAPFTLQDGQSVNIKMMANTGKDAKFGYMENDDFQMVSLPYKGDNLSMILMLPKNNSVSLDKYLDADQISQFMSYLSQSHQQRVDVYLPKFKFETKYDLANTLKTMGMPLAFSDTDADFSGMTGNKDLYIGNVIHQAYIDVNEEGTEAAAATVVGMQTMAAMPQPPKIFRADHPFIFLIEDSSTGEILFMGRVSDPTK